MPTLDLFATAPKGIEPLLADELTALGAERVRAVRAGVEFQGDLATAYRACLWSRLANRILMPLTQFRAEGPEALYDGVSSVDWLALMGPEASLAVDFTSVRSAITHSHFGALKVKDAIVDQLRAATGTRPSIDTTQPDIRVNCFIHHDRASLALDLSGESLHRRGYRLDGVVAPLKENLAAAILVRAGWPALAARGAPLIDPMCGSGTLPIEAALMAGDQAPGLLRAHYGFLAWRGHDPQLWQNLRQEAHARRAAGLARIPPIQGFDLSHRAIESAQQNAERAGLGTKVLFTVQTLNDLRRPSQSEGLMVVNPPYGERLGEVESLKRLYQEMGAQLKRDFGGWHFSLFTGNPDLQVGLKPERSYTLYNGAIECRLLNFQLHAQRPVEGERRERKAPPAPELSEGAQMLANRLRKNHKKLAKWLQQEAIDCYRLYDADLPEYALAIDLYQSERLWAHLQEYQAPKSIDEEKAAARVQEAVAAVRAVFELAPAQVILKQRLRQKGKAQYQPLGKHGQFHTVQEYGVSLLVNFTDYLDTGLFLDHRPVRHFIQARAQGKRFLNLFCYTGSATVHAAVGGAASSTSVDLSQTYLDWAQRNLALNLSDTRRHEIIRADCLDWLREEAGRPLRERRQYDLIFLDPPTFSNSKRMQGVFDVQRDHVRIIGWASRLLAEGGELIFSTNHRRFELDTLQLEREGALVEDLSQQTLPRDFERNQKIHHCWRIRVEPRAPRVFRIEHREE